METATAPATVAPVATPETETVALIVPRFTVATGEELQAGKTPKWRYLKERIAAGVEKAIALAEYDSAVASKHSLNALVASTAQASPNMVCARTKVKTDEKGRVVQVWATWKNVEDARAREERKRLDRIAKLEAKVAALKAAAK